MIPRVMVDKPQCSTQGTRGRVLRIKRKTHHFVDTTGKSKDQNLKFLEKEKKQLWNVFFFFKAASVINV